jgi:Spy/CpxP family protein refolding chaperone
MKKAMLAAAIALSALTFPAVAQMPMGPGMMGGNGMGPEMMGGYGMGGMMGPGMMGGMMGPGMMGGGYGGLSALNLTDDQRAKMAEIRKDAWSKQRAAMQAMHAQMDQMHESFDPGKADDAAALKAYDAMASAHKQMFQANLEARKRIDAVLTAEQREQWRRNWRAGCGF